MSNTRPYPVRRTTLIIGVTMVATAIFTGGQASAHGERTTGAPTQLSVRPPTDEPPAPTPPPAPPQALRPVGQECLDTTPQPGSTPAHPICDWNKIFAADQARADELRQQQRNQFESLADRVKAAPDR